METGANALRLIAHHLLQRFSDEFAIEQTEAIFPRIQDALLTLFNSRQFKLLFSLRSLGSGEFRESAVNGQ